ncbi:response regulator [Magnetococcus sp. PR-3]|uniref:response regulator n=1 Tax=Magnetococcus sp. PR-3 TaxID=3120355 RepID=UPI002FCE23E7
MGIQKRILLLIALFLLAAFSAVEWRSYHQLKTQAEADLRNQAEIVRGILMSTRRVYQHAFLESSIPLTRKTVKLLPAHALNRISKDFPNWFKGGVSFNNVSDIPRNKHQAANGVELEAMAFFRQNPTEQKWFTQYQDNQGAPYYHYATPIWIEEHCLKCHGSIEKAPEPIRAMYNTGFNYKLGELRGLMSIKLPAEHIDQLVRRQFIENGIIHLLIFGAAFFAMSYFLRRDVGRPLEAITSAVRDFGHDRAIPALANQPGEFQLLIATFHEMATTVVVREREVQERQAQIELLLDSAGEGIYAIDINGLCTLCNPTAAQLLGYGDSHQLIGKNIHELCHRADAEGTPIPVGGCPSCDVISNQSAVHLQLEYLQRQNGTLFPVEMRIHPMLQEGDAIGAVVLFNDISRRLDAEQKLQSSERHFRTLVEALPGIFYQCALDEDWTMYSLGQGIAALTGYPSDAFLFNRERSYASVIYAEDLHQVQREIAEAVAEKRVYNLEYRLEHTDGRPRWVMERGRAVYDEQGKAEVLYGVLLDISERKQYEQRLEQAKKQADAGNLAKSEFLAVMSHEIRTPLNAIMGMGDLLAESGLSTEQKHYLTVSQNAGETLVELIEDILDLSRIEAGELELDPGPFDVEQLVEEVCEVISASAHEKGLVVPSRVDPALPPVLVGDKKRIRQILFNLLFNAVKFTEQGEVVLDISHDSERAAPGAIILRVCDSGIGMAPEMLERVFDPFTQADSTITRQFGGSGLGLTICKRLTEKMGGSIELDSEVGLGTTVMIKLVLPVGSSRLVEVSREAVDLKGAHLLLVDDNRNNREIYTELLQQEGALVEACVNGQAAMALLEEGALFDLAILDFHMPSEDGLTLAGRIQAAEPDLPLLMLSSDQHPSAAKQAREMGITFLLKPVRRHLLRQTVGQLVKRHEHFEPAIVPKPVEPIEQKDGLKILLAEDVPENAMLIEAYVEQTPHQVVAVENGQLALERFIVESFDLVLMDIQMPVMNGLEATRTIRAWEKEQGKAPTPIVALTAHAMKEDAPKSMEAGCNKHLTKPIRKKVFLELLEAFTPEV